MEDDLADLLSEDLKLRGDINARRPFMPTDAAAVALRCKRSPRRSTSAKELYLNHRGSNINGNTGINGGGNTVSGFIAGSGLKMNGNSKALEINHPKAEKASETRPNPKCASIYLSGVIDSIDAKQVVR